MFEGYPFEIAFKRALLRSGKWLERERKRFFIVGSPLAVKGEWDSPPLPSVHRTGIPKSSKSIFSDFDPFFKLIWQSGWGASPRANFQGLKREFSRSEARIFKV